MMALLSTALGSVLGRLRLILAMVLACVAAIYVLLRQGRHQARAEFAIRQADARIAALQASKEIRNDVQKTNRAHLPERADRWMRD